MWRHNAEASHLCQSWYAPSSMEPAGNAVGNRRICCLQPNDFPTVPADGSYTGSVGLTYTSTLDLASNAVSEVVVTQTRHDMFCPGAHCSL